MKKLFKVLFAAVLLVSVAAVSICAEGSPLKFGAISSWEAYDAPENGNKLTSPEYYLTFQTVEQRHAHNNDQEQYDLIVDVNAGNKTISELLTQVGVMPSDARNVVMFAPIMDLTFMRELGVVDEEVVAYNVEVTFEVPNLVEGMGDIYIYHHSTLTGKDELIKPKSVDYANKAVTVFFTDLSPITVIGVQTVKKPVDTAAMDYTGLFAALAAVAALALFAVNKKEKTAA